MRTQAREKAFQLIFERLFVKNSYSFDEEFFSSLTKEEDREFSSDLVKLFENHQEQLKELISTHLVGYELDRVYKVDLALIYLALTEIIFIETPYKIVINEVLTIAKKFSTVNSNKFINGVLSSIIKDLK